MNVCIIQYFYSKWLIMYVVSFIKILRWPNRLYIDNISSSSSSSFTTEYGKQRQKELGFWWFIWKQSARIPVPPGFYAHFCFDILALLQESFRIFPIVVLRCIGERDCEIFSRCLSHTIWSLFLETNIFLYGKKFKLSLSIAANYFKLI